MAFAINTQKVLLCAQCPTARAFFSEREPVWIVVPIVARVVPHRPISSPIPGMPDGKPANTRCVQLAENNLCMIFGSPLRPKVCSGLQPSAEMCGSTREQAITYLLELEALTAP